MQAVRGWIGQTGLRRRQPLQNAEMALAQSRRRQYGDFPSGHGYPRRTPGTAEVAAIHGGKRMAAQAVGKRPRLGFASGVEVNVDLALDAFLGIPVRLAVTNQAESGGRAHAPDFKLSRASLRSMRARFCRT
jgi:hypothetical protein